jgi:hypothetical protein
MTFGAETPPAGRQGIVNLMHRASDGAYDGLKLVGDFNDPLLKPAAAAQVKRLGDISKTGNAFPDPSNQCAPQQPPYILRQQEIQLLQGKDEVTILYMLDHHVRHVRLNAQHPSKVAPSWMGDSIGHYEGDTLVVDTVGIKTGKFSSIDRFGTPYSEAMHVVERYRFLPYEAAKEAIARGEKEWGHVGAYDVDPAYRGRGLQLEFRVEDPGVFTMPWTATVTYLRSSNKEWEERACAENVGHYYSLTQYYSDKDAHVPTAEKADF